MGKVAGHIIRWKDNMSAKPAVPRWTMISTHPVQMKMTHVGIMFDIMMVWRYIHIIIDNQ
jgi:hypothetical protein